VPRNSESGGRHSDSCAPSENLAQDEEIAFNAGSYTELVDYHTKDFEKVVKPRVVKP
jgi:hypothetical protein